MNAAQLARGAVDEEAAEKFYENERRIAEETTTGDTLDGLYLELKELIPPKLHSLCAHILTRSKAVVKSGTAAEMQVIGLAEEFRNREELERRPRTMEEAVALVNEIARSQHGVGTHL